MIKFKDNKVYSITYMGDCFQCYKISNIGILSSYEGVLDKFGTPSNTSTSKDQTERILSFSKYNVFFQLSKNTVKACGIYNKNIGEMVFINGYKK